MRSFGRTLDCKQSQHGLTRGARRLSHSQDLAMGCADQVVLCLKLHTGLHEATLVIIGSAQ